MVRQPLRLERWTFGNYWVLRDKKGRFISKIRQKGSGLKKRIDAERQYKENKTLSKGKIKTKAGLIKKDKNILDVVRIGKDTEIVLSKKPINKLFQVSARVRWGDNLIVGYSKITTDYEEAKSDAFEKTVAVAILKDILGYDWSYNNPGGTSGFAQSPDGKKIVFFIADYRVFNYKSTKRLNYEEAFTN